MILKVVSLNLWWGGNLFPAILEFLKAENADVLLLQEVLDGKQPGLLERQRSLEILAQLGYPYTSFASAFILDDPAGDMPMGNAVLSKLPLKAQPTIALTEPTKAKYQDIPENWPILPRQLQHVRLETPVGEVNIFNIHGVWDLNGDDYSPARQKMGKSIIGAIKGQPNVILAGDSNATSGNPLMRELEKQLNSVFGRDLTTTFNMRHKDNPGYATADVDVMFVSPNIEIISKACPNVDISDHLPLVVSLDIN